jgi:hypothetical protein
MFIRERIYTLGPIEWLALYLFELSPANLVCQCASSHCEVSHYRLAATNVVMLLKKVNLVSSAASGMTLEKPRIIDLEYRKTGILILVKRAPSVFLGVFT